MLFPLADLSLAFFWRSRLIRVHSGKRGETRWIFSPFFIPCCNCASRLLPKSVLNNQISFMPTTTFSFKFSVCRPPPPDTRWRCCPAAPHSPSPSLQSTTRSLTQRHFLTSSTLVSGLSICQPNSLLYFGIWWVLLSFFELDYSYLFFSP